MARVLDADGRREQAGDGKQSRRTRVRRVPASTGSATSRHRGCSAAAPQNKT